MHPAVRSPPTLERAWQLRADPHQPGVGDEDPELEIFLRSSTGRRLLCRFCHEIVTTEGHRVEIEGRHVHRRINPVGIEFEFGCFGAARGAVVVGEATAEHSWFAGYTWRYSLCRGCGSHLGWFFDGGETFPRRGTSKKFHGLILNRLELESSAERT